MPGCSTVVRDPGQLDSVGLGDFEDGLSIFIGRFVGISKPRYEENPLIEHAKNFDGRPTGWLKTSFVFHEEPNCMDFSKADGLLRVPMRRLFPCGEAAGFCKFV